MRILGIDPGYATIGFGLVTSERAQVHMETYGAITTGIAVAHGRGVILYAAEHCGIPLYEYTPSQVKLAVTGYGKAEKRQVMDMTKRLLKLKAVPRPDDAADALALALCHARSATSRLPHSSTVRETI